MSGHHVFPDAEGWVMATRFSEGGPLPNGALPDGVPVSSEEGEAALAVPGMFHHRDGALSCPHDDRRAWHELRHFTRPAAIAHQLARFRDARSAVPRDLPPELACRPASGTCVAAWTCDHVLLPTLPWSPPEVPGLVVRLVEPDDLDHIAEATVAIGAEPARCPNAETPCCQPPEAHTWLALAHRMHPADVWAFCVTWEGAPIQVELMQHGPVPVSTATWHLNSERAAWFWRECWRPIAEGLLDLGYARVRGLVRGDLTAWVENLKTLYGAKHVGHYQGGGHQLEYDLAAIPFTGFPGRRSAPGWTWEHAASGLSAREMASESYEEAAGSLDRLWGGTHPQLPTVRRLLDDAWHLDRASVVLVSEGPRPVGVFAIRHRTGTTGSLLVASRHAGDPATDLPTRMLYRGVCEWAHAAGYTTLTTRVPAARWANATHQRLLVHTRATVVGRRESPTGRFVEISRDLAAIHAEPMAAWERWNPDRPALPAPADIS